MARTVRNAKLDTRSARAKLPHRREPYWTVVTQGCAVGYRKGLKGGTWIARFRDEAGKQHYNSLGAADDALDPNGETVLSFGQAQEKAREWFVRVERGLLDEENGQQKRSGPYKVQDALTAYMAWHRIHRKGTKTAQYAVDALILPDLGHIPLAKLTRRRVRSWHEKLAASPPRLRTARGQRQRFKDGTDDPEFLRRRRSTANRVLTILKAALNRAHREGKVSSDDAWRHVVSFREADAARVRYLKDEEAQRLVNASSEPFRSLVVAALMTGARYSELAAVRAADFDANARTVSFTTTKGGKPRHVALTDEGATFFGRAVAGKASGDLVFRKASGEPWKRTDQRRPMLEACNVAKIMPAAGFHVLRHTYASRLAMKGVPLAVIAAQLGHRDTRMVELHYGHLSASYVSETVRQAFAPLGIVETDNVTPMRRS